MSRDIDVVAVKVYSSLLASRNLEYWCRESSPPCWLPG